MAEIINLGGYETKPLTRALQLLDGVNTVTISATSTITAKSGNILSINGGAANRNVDFTSGATGSEKNGALYLVKNAGTTNNLVMRDSAAATVATLAPGQWAIFAYTGAAWVLLSPSAVAQALTSISLTDNQASALDITEGANSYLKFVTTNSSEKVQVGKTLQADVQVTTDTIAEKTTNSGVTVDGCLVKDGRAAALATAAMTVSAEQTGTGSSQTVAHSIGATPSLFWVGWTDIPVGGCSVTSVSVDATNVTLTATTGAKYRIYALK